MKKLLVALGAVLFAFHALAAPSSKVKHRAHRRVDGRRQGLVPGHARRHQGRAEEVRPGPGRVQLQREDEAGGRRARRRASTPPSGFDIVIAHGAQYKNLVLEMAEEFPKTTFAFGTSAEVGPKNVFTYMPRERGDRLPERPHRRHGHQDATSSGWSARWTAATPPATTAASSSGVKAVNPKAEVKVAHTGSFGDFVKAGELAQTHIKAGADVLTGSSQQALGALQAVATYKDKPIWWVGQDTAQLAIPESAKVIAAASYDYAAGHRAAHRQAPGRHPGRREPAAQLPERRLRLQVQRRRGPGPHQGDPRQGGRRQGEPRGRQAPARLEEREVLGTSPARREPTMARAEPIGELALSADHQALPRAPRLRPRLPDGRAAGRSSRSWGRTARASPPS